MSQKQNMRCVIATNTEIWICLLLVCIGLFAIKGEYPTKEGAATFAGALIGGAALLLGNWINRYNERQKAKQELEQRRIKLNTLITAELVNVAAGLIGATGLIDAAFTTLNARGQVPTQCDLSGYMPRDMPVTDALGVELLLLEQPAIDALTTLRCNLSITRMEMEAISNRPGHFSLLKIIALRNGLRHDMSVLADAFDHIAPTRQLKLNNKPAELATVILKRIANEGGDE